MKGSLQVNREELEIIGGDCSFLAILLASSLDASNNKATTLVGIIRIVVEEMDGIT